MSPVNLEQVDAVTVNEMNQDLACSGCGAKALTHSKVETWHAVDGGPAIHMSIHGSVMNTTSSLYHEPAPWPNMISVRFSCHMCPAISRLTITEDIDGHAVLKLEETEPNPYEIQCEKSRHKAVERTLRLIHTEGPKPV